MIYFIAANDGRIKIGFSRNAGNRIREISSYVGSVEVLGIIADGSAPLEKAIHRELNNFRIKGEWFRDCDILRSHIRDLVFDSEALAKVASKIMPREAPKPYEPCPPDPLAIGRVLNLIWGDNTLMQFRAFTGASEEECLAWLSGETRPPRVLAYAIGALVVMYATAREGDPPPDFIDDPEN